MKLLWICLACIAMLGANAHRAGRFSAAEDTRAKALVAAAERVAGLPTSIGEWNGEEYQGSDVASLHRSGAVGFVSRIYWRGKSEEPMSLLLVCGKAGPLAVHTPEACYAGASYSPDPNQRRLNVAETHEFTWQSFASKVDGQPDLEIAWAWTTDGRWSCPDSPRVTYGRQPFLFKLYVARRLRGKRQPSAEMQGFLRAAAASTTGSIFAAEKDNRREPPPTGANVRAAWESGCRPISPLRRAIELNGFEPFAARSAFEFVEQDHSRQGS